MKNYLKQAVILAGGRGTRLKPLTDTRPKPMIEFHGKPFLEYLIESLRDQGIQKVLLLLGYLPDVVKDYFGDGKKFGIEIEYSVTDEENDTGTRIRLAAKKIDPCFLLMYCDNYWPLNLEDMWQHYKKKKVKAQLTVYSNKDKYTKDNVIVDDNGFIIKYDKTRTAKDLQGVDICYAIIDKSVLDLLPEENILFETMVYPRLAEEKQLAAYVSDHRYYSVGSFDRLEMTKEFLRFKPSIILDRDGVLNKKAPKAQYVKTWDEFKWLPGSKEAIAMLTQAGYRVIIVTNQAGITRGMMSESDLHILHEQMKKDMESAGGKIDAIYHCPHHWDDGCQCRKPLPGMFFAAQRDLYLDLSRTYFVGDDERDEQAAKAAGCKYMHVSGEQNLRDAVTKILGEKIE
ncbi:MAG: D-glycero-beta-D-manno-heptose 1,7-bisphosphate 7-phosphatase [Candidatus Saganbacteria bacterium]|nr:D-glycero-beta-D-manno-heptose 1,7-bisphosphate 7-phosphatase [Candidatus Saganbacteria bacterium]